MSHGQEEKPEAPEPQELHGRRDPRREKEAGPGAPARPEVAPLHKSSGFYWTPEGIRCALTGALAPQQALASAWHEIVRLRNGLKELSATTNDPKTIVAVNALLAPVKT